MRSPFIKFVFLVLLVCFLSCQNNPEKKKIDHTDGTSEMRKELEQIASDRSNINTWHLNKIRAQAIDKQLESTSELGQRLSLLFRSGIEWLNAGDIDKSIEKINGIFLLLDKQNIKLPPKQIYKFKEVLAMAYLRKAEVENCLQNHNEYSCIFPIHEKGQHVNKIGSEKAVELFRELLLSENPELQTRWLYNVAHMTLGTYPSKVEPELLIEESYFKSDILFPRFRDVAMSAGVAVDDISGSVVMDDFNNDGYFDLFVSSYGVNDQLRYFQNNKKNGFEDLTEASGITGLFSGLNMVQADYNNDGWIDIFILRGAWLGEDGLHPNSLLRNNGDGTFTDVTRQSGLYCKFPTQTASWADYNNDGWIDLFIGNEHSNSLSAPAQLFQNKGDGTFVNVAESKGLAIQGFIKGCVWGDYNNDGYPDVYISMINNYNLLMENGGPENNFSFTDKSQYSKTKEPLLSFPCWFFDFNQDGWEDIFVSGFDFRQFETAAGEVTKDMLGMKVDAELPKLYKNNRDGTFSDVSQSTNLDKVLYTMGCNFGDLNNDGYPDFYAATGTPDFRALIPNKMFLNAEGKEFYDVTTAGGFGHLQKGHGVAFGDVDNDGDQDIYNVLGGSYDGDNFMNALYLNPGNQNSWIKIKLIGKTSNRSAIGAKVKFIVSDKSGNKKTFYHRVNSGGSFGANPLTIEQGLNSYNNIEEIEITWPSQSKKQKLKNIEVNSFYLITEGEAVTEKLILNEMEFNEMNHSHH